jgi:hypothetical protein
MTTQMNNLFTLVVISGKTELMDGISQNKETVLELPMPNLTTQSSKLKLETIMAIDLMQHKVTSGYPGSHSAPDVKRSSP